MSEVKMDDIVSLAKRRGFIFPGSDVYGGLSGTWDYGPLGLVLKRNIMNLWWKTFVENRDDMYGVDAAILMNQKVWQASGHVDTFTDPLVECGKCGNRFRADLLIKNLDDINNLKLKIKDNQGIIWIIERYEDEKYVKELGVPTKKQLDDAVLQLGQIGGRSSHIFLDGLFGLLSHNDNNLNENQRDNLARRLISDPFINLFAIQLYLEKVKCPNCKSSQFGPIRQFNMMFKTNVGPVDDESSVSYLRPETAQGIFTNYRNVVDTFYPDVPFGIAQMGKAFRNEISPRDFVFRSREFEQMEIEYFVHPGKWEEAFKQWQDDIKDFLKELGLEKVYEVEVPTEDRAHYSKRTIDYEYDFPHRRDELLGLAYRTDFDLMNIQMASGKGMEYRPKDGGDPFVPHVIEPSFGVERAMTAVLTSAYTEDEVNGEKRVFLKLPAHLAPVKVAVSPLLKNKPELVEKAREVCQMLKKEFGNVMWDDNGNIGKRYRRQDEIGTPYCVVIDFDTLEDNTVTIRDRDTTEQKRVEIKDVISSVS